MYAVVKTGGKEYRISQGDLIRVEKMEGKVGDQVTMKDILMVSHEGQVQVGNPLLANAVITGENVQQVKGKKVLIYKIEEEKELPTYQRTPPDLYLHKGKRYYSRLVYEWQDVNNQITSTK